MKYTTFALPILSFFSIGMSSAETESERLHSFFDRTYQEDLDRAPMSQTYRGIKKDYGEWGDFSEKRTKEDHQIALARKQTIASFDRAKLSSKDRLSLRLYEIDLQSDLDQYPFRHHWYTISQFYGWHTNIPSFLINMHKVDSVSDAEAYISRLGKVEALLDQIIEQLRIREKAGIFPPRWAYPQILEASANVLKGAPFDKSAKDSTLLSDFRSKVDSLEASNNEKHRLLEAAEKALRTSFLNGYRKLIAELEKQAELAPALDGVWKLPDGIAYYNNRLKYYTSTDLTANQVHQIGLEQVERIHGEMKAIMKAVGFEGDLQAFFAFMREDPRFYFEDSEEGRAAYLKRTQEIIDAMQQRLPEVFGILPKAALRVKRVEAFRERAAGKAFYQSPAEDGSRPGTYYANLYDMSSMPNYQMEALAYHEAIPGHHMQLSIKIELGDVPDFQRYLRMTAYSEGWGLYSEMLPKEMGFYEDPYSDFGRLAMELWRACRLVVDTGIHTKRWTREQAIDYLKKNTPNSEVDATKAIERYIVYAGQATAYLIGKMKIHELREWAKSELGPKFDIRGFHDEVLKDGSVPLSVLEEKIQNWVVAIKSPN